MYSYFLPGWIHVYTNALEADYIPTMQILFIKQTKYIALKRASNSACLGTLKLDMLQEFVPSSCPLSRPVSLLYNYANAP